MVEVDKRMSQGQAETLPLELMTGVPNREVMQQLSVEDRVIFAAWGLNRLGEGPYYPKEDSPVVAAFRDFVKEGNRVQQRNSLLAARGMYEETVNDVLSDIANTERNREFKDERGIKRAQKTRKYLLEQGFVDQVSVEDLRDFAFRRIKQSRVNEILLPKRKPGVDPRDLRARGYIIDKYQK